MDHKPTQEQVDSALNVAFNENGYTELAELPPLTVALDLCTNDADFEQFDLEDVCLLVQNWQDRTVPAR